MFKGGMMELFQQAKQLNEEFTKFQRELETLHFEGSAGAGMVKAKVNGKQEILSVEIAPELVEGKDRQMIQDLVTAAVNQALSTAKEKIAEQMKSRMGGLGGGLGGLASLFGGQG